MLTLTSKIRLSSIVIRKIKRPKRGSVSPKTGIEIQKFILPKKFIEIQKYMSDLPMFTIFDVVTLPSLMWIYFINYMFSYREWCEQKFLILCLPYERHYEYTSSFDFYNSAFNIRIRGHTKFWTVQGLFLTKNFVHILTTMCWKCTINKHSKLMSLILVLSSSLTSYTLLREVQYWLLKSKNCSTKQ